MPSFKRFIRILKYPLPTIPETLSGDEEIRDYLYRLRRAIEENLRRLHALVWSIEDSQLRHSNKVFIAKVVSSAMGTGWYNATMYELDDDGAQVALGTTSDTVLNLIDEDEEVQGLQTDDLVMCFRTTPSDVAPAKYAGVEFFGRTTIGLCPPP